MPLSPAPCGRGALTFALLGAAVRCTLLEPRPAQLSRSQHRQLEAAGVRPPAGEGGAMAAGVRRGAGMAEMPAQEAFEQSDDDEEEEEETEAEEIEEGRGSGAGAGLAPRTAGTGQAGAEADRASSSAWPPPLPQLQRRFEPALWRLPLSCCGAGGGRDEGGVGEGGAEQAAAPARGPSPATGPEAAGEEAEAVAELLRNCSLVVGLHPDQATEAILDFALQGGKPFALLPCCVFPRLFPGRRLRLRPGGGPGGGGGGPGPGPGAAASGESPSGTGPLNAADLESVIAAAAAAPAAGNRGNGGAAGDGDGGNGWVSMAVESYPQLVAYLLQRAEAAAEPPPSSAMTGPATAAATLEWLGAQAGAGAWESAGGAAASAAEGVGAAAAAEGVGAAGPPVAPEAACGADGGAGGGGGQGSAGVVRRWRPGGVGRVGVVRLPFEGANLAVFRLPAEAEAEPEREA
ncbi:hypothetical protein GPECTOR_6g861 [Gonium pectorale]|uniref:Methyltransferase domain-containing protein n=1 Tax=Gonium pectorale TaxID=33097 RepID=A0A150GW01_GONPE|nr:hypothetical protein GPECTOR_6g861 [Gonium pectorale]|eukprot:KXZ53943.1 hypothetical protein GPECTOR_6g861 [Gonium pectorale]